MAHQNEIYDTDMHFIIDENTKQITPYSEQIVLGQYDHNSERFTFELPRYIDGHDMSLCNRVEVHYLNIDDLKKNKKSGVYEVDDLQISTEDENIVLFSWLVSQNATQIAGSLQFLIRFACVTDGELDYAWNTTIFSTISIASGMYYGEAVVEEYADILAQWKAELDVAGVKTVNGIEPDENGNVAVEVGSDITVDDTLTIEGAAADAKVTGEKITYLQDQIAVGADWNANEGEAGYVKNRPFWREKSKLPLLPGMEMPITITTADMGGMIGATANVAFVEGTTNYVVFDGIEYECMPYYDETAQQYVIGSLGFRDYPFCIATGVIITKTAGEHTVAQYYESYEVKIDFCPHLIIKPAVNEDRKPYLSLEQVEKIKDAYKKGVYTILDTNYLSTGVNMHICAVEPMYICASGIAHLENKMVTQLVYWFNISDGSLRSSQRSYLGTTDDGYPKIKIGNRFYKVNVDTNGNLTATELT